MPMTDEMLKKLSRVSQDSDRILKSSELVTVLVHQDFNTAFELNLQQSENDPPTPDNNAHH